MKIKPYKLKILPAASNDLLQARAWYRQFNPDSPKRFLSEISRCMDRLRLNPTVHAVRYREVRMATLTVFPYAVHYFIEESTHSIVIVAIHHSAINPDRWEQRLK